MDEISRMKVDDSRYRVRACFVRMCENACVCVRILRDDRMREAKRREQGERQPVNIMPLASPSPVGTLRYKVIYVCNDNIIYYV